MLMVAALQDGSYNHGSNYCPRSIHHSSDVSLFVKVANIVLPS
jgi:hypothetical protein